MWNQGTLSLFNNIKQINTQTYDLLQKWFIWMLISTTLEVHCVCSDTETIPILYLDVKRGGRGFPQWGDDEVGKEGKHQ